MQKPDQLLALARQAKASVEQAQRALALLDLTSLNDDDTAATITALCQRAQTPVGPVAAVCVYPQFVAQARSELVGSQIQVATVVNFPSGDEDSNAVQALIETALNDGAQEIDVVLPYKAYLNGQRQEAIALVADTCETCKGRARVKVIVETGALQDPDIILAASRDSIAAGVDFVKTSTGKININATLEACVPMLQAISEADQSVGLKPSGGVRSTEEAAQYLALADAVMGPDWATSQTFRFGASSLLNALLTTLGHARTTASSGGY